MKKLAFVLAVLVVMAATVQNPRPGYAAEEWCIGDPILVVTGGDPLMRRDVYDLLTYAVQKGLRTSLTPSATALVTPKNLAKVQDAGSDDTLLNWEKVELPAVLSVLKETPPDW